MNKDLVKRRLKKLGKSMKDLGIGMGMTESAGYRLMRGWSWRGMKVGNLLKLCEFIGASPDEVLGYGRK